MLTWAAEVGETRDGSMARYEERTLSTPKPRSQTL